MNDRKNGANGNLGKADKATKAAKATKANKSAKPSKAVKANKHDRKRPLRAELVFILDASGSMGGLEDDTIGGFNTMIDENRELPGEAKVSVVTFNDRSNVQLDRVDIDEVPHLTRKEYRCSGCTALLDAVGGAIDHIDLVQRVQPKGYEAQKVLFAITTDGMENASRRYTYARVKHLIERHREMGWEFIFIGANIDVEAEAERLGIDRQRAVPYIADDFGTGAVYRAASGAVHAMRCDAPLESSGWRDELDEDVRTRGGK